MFVIILEVCIINKITVIVSKDELKKYANENIFFFYTNNYYLTIKYILIQIIVLRKKNNCLIQIFKGILASRQYINLQNDKHC